MENKTKIIIGAVFIVIGFALIFLYNGFSRVTFYNDIGPSAVLFTLLLMIPPVILLISDKLNINKTIKILICLYVVLVMILSIVMGISLSNMPGSPGILVYGILSLISAYLIN